MMASHGGHQRLAQQLIISGANLMAVDAEGDTALDYARAHGHTSIIDVLRRAMEESSANSTE